MKRVKYEIRVSTSRLQPVTAYVLGKSWMSVKFKDADFIGNLLETG